jgi:ligand-binding sensor domain-containing protein
LKDSKGNIWFGTNHGLDKYDGIKFMHFSVAQGLSGESITSICEDKTGNLWLGMEYDSMLNKWNCLLQKLAVILLHTIIFTGVPSLQSLALNRIKK